MTRSLGSLSSLALSRLNTKPGTAICARARALETKISELDFSEASHEALAQARLQASTTLFKEMYVPGPSLGQWADANQHVIKTISAEKILDAGVILDLHRCLYPETSGNFRSKTVQGGNTAYPDAKDLPELWEIFKKRLPETLTMSPVLGAAEVYQWIITLHFFEDANGRLARLCADFILLSGGLPPLSFENDVAGFASALAEPDFYTVDDAIQRVCEGVTHSLQVLEVVD